MHTKTTICVGAALQKVYQNLIQTAALENNFKYHTWIAHGESAYSGKHFYGSCTANQFKLVPVVYGKNFFTPIFLCNLMGKNGGTQIHISIENSPCMKHGYILLSMLTLGPLLAFLFSLDLICLIVFVVSLIIICLFDMINKNTKKKSFESFKKSIYELFLLQG